MQKVYFALKFLNWNISNLKFILLKPAKIDVTFVTAADYTHQKSLENLLESLFRFEQSSRIVVYNLGIEDSFLTSLKKKFNTIEFRDFPWANFPDFFNIKVNAGNYAWKPAIIARVMDEVDGALIWMDAGNIVTGRLNFLRKILCHLGFFSPYSEGLVREWTHEGTLSALKVEGNILKRRNLGANMIAIDTNDLEARELISSWAKFAGIKECIAPSGSDRTNHRQDQSLLTILAYQSGLANYGNLGNFPRRVFRILVHQDAD